MEGRTLKIMAKERTNLFADIEGRKMENNSHQGLYEGRTESHEQQFFVK